jgi:hypothetical protein
MTALTALLTERGLLHPKSGGRADSTHAGRQRGLA